MADFESTKFLGHFCCNQNELLKKLSGLKAFVFDWDGVFNDGFKTSQNGSGFSETDSMGINLLRFSHYLIHKKLPICAIISGEKNEAASFFAKRECFHYNFYKIAHKIDALNTICKEHNISPEEVAYFFDDVLDLSIAKVAGLKILIHKKASAFFTDFCIKNHYADYISSYSGAENGLRECCEMMMVNSGNFETVLKHRTEYNNEYIQYLEERKKIETAFFTKNEEGKPVKC